VRNRQKKSRIAAVADPQALKRGGESKKNQPCFDLLQMYIMNYTHFIKEKATYWQKLRPRGGPPHCIAVVLLSVLCPLSSKRSKCLLPLLV